MAEDRFMKTKLIAGALLVASSASFTPADAHHSAAALYQLDKEITVEGVVTSYTLGNPHARIYLKVKGQNGAEEEWMAEGGSRTVLIRKGWTGEEVHPGDTVKIIGNPSRDGSKVVHWEKLVLPDGRELWGEDISPNDLDRLRERRKAHE
jgi:hypothetical protein